MPPSGATPPHSFGKDGGALRPVQTAFSACATLRVFDKGSRESLTLLRPPSWLKRRAINASSSSVTTSITPLKPATVRRETSDQLLEALDDVLVSQHDLATYAGTSSGHEQHRRELLHGMHALTSLLLGTYPDILSSERRRVKHKPAGLDRTLRQPWYALAGSSSSRVRLHPLTTTGEDETSMAADSVAPAVGELDPADAAALPAARRSLIRDLARRKGQVLVSDLASYLGVSDDTIRRRSRHPPAPGPPYPDPWRSCVVGPSPGGRGDWVL